jgi:hypothetical protein
MNTKTIYYLITATIVSALTATAGDAQKWNKLREAVRATVLANGGKKGDVDKEGFKNAGQDVYEAVGKDKNGNQVDLEIRADGKLIQTKNDDAAADVSKETAARTRDILSTLTFSHPRDITNPWLPLSSLKQDILQGTEDGKKLRVERTIKPEVHKTFKIGKQKIDSLCMEDREFVGGELEEVTLDYFAQADDGTVLYLGEDVNEYKDGKVAGHSGAWLLGKQTKIPGVMMVAEPKIGDRFRPEDVGAVTIEDDEVMSLNETVTVPAGTYKDCLKVKEILSDGKTEYKLHAKGIGVVKELPSSGALDLISHTAK